MYLFKCNFRGENVLNLISHGRLTKIK